MFLFLLENNQKDRIYLLFKILIAYLYIFYNFEKKTGLFITSYTSVQFHTYPAALICLKLNSVPTIQMHCEVYTERTDNIYKRFTQAKLSVITSTAYQMSCLRDG